MHGTNAQRHMHSLFANNLTLAHSHYCARTHAHTHTCTSQQGNSACLNTHISPHTHACIHVNILTYSRTHTRIHAGATTCIACTAGKHAPDSNSSQCMACVPGTYDASPHGGSSSCDICANGTFSDSAAGNQACRACPAGTYSEEPADPSVS
jgi:hypothetical protein